MYRRWGSVRDVEFSNCFNHGERIFTAVPAIANASFAVKIKSLPCYNGKRGEAGVLPLVTFIIFLQCNITMNRSSLQLDDSYVNPPVTYTSI